MNINVKVFCKISTHKLHIRKSCIINRMQAQTGQIVAVQARIRRNHALPLVSTNNDINNLPYLVNSMELIPLCLTQWLAVSGHGSVFHASETCTVSSTTVRDVNGRLPPVSGSVAPCKQKIYVGRFSAYKFLPCLQIRFKARKGKLWTLLTCRVTGRKDRWLAG
jgi:hypothetical protein